MEPLTGEFRQLMEKYEQELRALQQRGAPPPVATPAPPTPSAPPAPSTFTAPLRVRVTSANEAIPIPNALVIVTREENGETVVEASRLTDQSGLTEPIVLSAADPALTLQPGTAVPLIVHEITVAAPDHYRARIRNIPLYGGIPTELPVSLIPIPEFAEDTEREMQYDTPPIDL